MRWAKSAMEALECPNATILAPLTGGRDAAIWRVQWEGAEYALRILRPEQSAVARCEVAAMDAARTAGLPVPEVVRFGEWEGRPVQLIAWVPGETALSALQRQPERLGEIGNLLGRTLASIHNVPVPPELDVLSATPGTTLLHRDFHPLNVLIDGERVTGIIDWTDTCAGNPLADIAQSITLISVAPTPSDIPPEQIEPIRAALVESIIAGYTAVRGPLPSDHKMAPFYVLAAQRMYSTLEARSHQPESGITPESLQRIQNWIIQHAAIERQSN